MPSREETEMSTRLILGPDERERYEAILELLSSTTSRGQRRAIEKERNHIEDTAKAIRAVDAANVREARRQAGVPSLGDSIRRLFGGQ